MTTRQPPASDRSRRLRPEGRPRSASRGAVGLALLLLLTGCTGPGDPTAEGGGGTIPPSLVPVEVSPSAPSPVEVSPSGTPPGVELEPDIYRIDPSTGEAVPILTAVEELHEPKRSPDDGSRLAYHAMTSDGTFQIFVLKDGREHQLTHLLGGAIEPTWSPDGSQIAFAGAEGDARGFDIFVMGARGADIRPVARTLEQDRRPDWSPDGSRIVFDTLGEILMVSVDDGDLTELALGGITMNQGPAADATWSPDGRWILITRVSPSTMNGELGYAVPWIVRPDGSNEHRLIPSRRPWGILMLDPAWSPDGSSIAFADASKGIGIVDVRTGKVVSLPTELPITDLSWGPNELLASMGVRADPSPSLFQPSWPEEALA